MYYGFGKLISRTYYEKMMKEDKIPFFQILYAVAILLLIVFRILFNNIGLYINLANYISMVLSVAFVLVATISKIRKRRRRNIYKSVISLILIVSLAVGIYILVFRVDIPDVINDIFTLIALMFCICNKMIEFIIIGMVCGLKD